MIKRILGWVGIIGILGALFVLTAMKVGFVTALIVWGAGGTIAFLLAGSVALALSDDDE